MPIVGDAKEVAESMKKTYGKDWEKVFYSTANKQGRKAENWKKKSATEKLAAILDTLPDISLGELRQLTKLRQMAATGKTDNEISTELARGLAHPLRKHPKRADVLPGGLAEDKKYYDHLEKMEQLGGKIMKAAALAPQKTPGIAGVGTIRKFVDPKTGQPPALAAGAPAPQGKPTTTTPKVAAAPTGPMGPMTRSAPAPAVQPTAPGISTQNPTPTAPTTAVPAGNKMAIAAVPRAKTASHADLIKAQFQALRLSGVLSEV